MINKDRPKIWFSLVIVMVLLLSSLMTGCISGKTVKIGFVAQLTGSDSYIGQAAKLALEDRVK